MRQCHFFFVLMALQAMIGILVRALPDQSGTIRVTAKVSATAELKISQQ